jgi:hypothetical protein
LGDGLLGAADLQHSLIGRVGGCAGEPAQDRLGGGRASTDSGGVFDELIIPPALAEIVRRPIAPGVGVPLEDVVPGQPEHARQPVR